MKRIFKNRKIIIAAVTLLTGVLFAVTVCAYGMSENQKAISGSTQEEQAMKKAAQERHQKQLREEKAAATVESVAKVAAAPQEEPVQTVVEEWYVEEPVYNDFSGNNFNDGYAVYYAADELRYHGVIYEGGWRWTWYSQRVLPGGGLTIPGRHVDENGYICDENGRICLASSDLEYGTVVSTPFGKEGCIYDCGCSSGTLDVYVDF